MTEDELRSLVRATIAKVKGQHVSSGFNLVNPSNAGHPSHHASHAMFVVTSGADESGPCIIEPAVACNHCGYCKSLGH